MRVPAAPIFTAALRPDLFASPGKIPLSPGLLVLILSVLVLGGFAFRAASLGAEALSDDELNKYDAVVDYRQHGVTSANGEHPMLMKALIAASLISAEHWNSWRPASSNPKLKVSVETALRLPCTILGALTILVLYAVAADLFGQDVALIAAALWAFDPSVIGFNRIAKEDTFVVFFFLLANAFWLKGQKVAELEPEKNPEPYYWATAAAFGAMIASKYLPHMIVISLSFNYIFQGIPATRWRIGKRRFLIFFVIMGAVFLICNPAILIPDTIRQMIRFASYKAVGHGTYEFMGRLYSHKLMLWLTGVPWYFYLTYFAVKMPLVTLGGMIVGVPLLFRKRTGDGRFFILFWGLFWFIPFSLMGGKFTRYLTLGYAPALMISAIGLVFIADWLGRLFAGSANLTWIGRSMRIGVAALAIIPTTAASIHAMPYYRLYMNQIGGHERAGFFFPHDEFYDGAMRDVVLGIAARARQGASVATEVPEVGEFYARMIGRPDLNFVWSSDPALVKTLNPGDFVMDARGRRYKGNEDLLSVLHRDSVPAFSVRQGDVPSVDVFQLDTKSRDDIVAVIR